MRSPSPDTSLEDLRKRREYYASTRDRQIAASNAWNKANRERCNENARRMNARTPERHRDHVKSWRAENPEKVAAQDFRRNMKRRAVMYDALVETVDRDSVFLRDQGICGICGESVDPQDFHVDHIVPLSGGGQHSYDNVQVAHPMCNFIKGGRMAAEFMVP